MIWWFLGMVAGSVVVLYIGSRLPARKVRRAQFGYDDPSVKEYGEHCRNLHLERYHSN